MYVPSVWLHLPTWVMPTLASGAAVGLIYWIGAELMDGLAGLLAALFLASLSWFHVYSILLTSHVPMLLLGLGLTWAFLNWRRQHALPWAAVLGALAGWAAITRPADAFIYALPIGIVMAWTLLRHRPRRWLLTPIIVLIAAAPFLALQIVFDKGVTGHAFRPPYGYYLQRDQPGSAIGFHRFQPEARPESSLAQKQELYERWVRPRLAEHTPGNVGRLWIKSWLPMVADTTLPCRLFLVFVPVALLGLGMFGKGDDPAPSPLYSGERVGVRGESARSAARGLASRLVSSVQGRGDRDLASSLVASRQAGELTGEAASGGGRASVSDCLDGPRWVLWATLPLFFVVYTFNPFFLEHYAIVLIPAVTLSVLLGIDALAATWPRFCLPIKAGCGAMLVVACLTSFWEINQLVASSATQVSDETFRSDYMRLTNRDLQGYGVKPPAVVLFRYHPGGMLWSVPEFIQEPVYNVDVAWPDEAPIIRAHDLGPVRNREIFSYYAKTQPDRVFWSLDAARGNDALKRLGTARELAAEGEKP